MANYRLNYIRFEPTDNTNIVIGIKEIREKIYLDKLAGQINDINRRIDELGYIDIPQDLPDDIRIILENRNAEIEMEKEQLIEKRQQLLTLVEELRANGYNI